MPDNVYFSSLKNSKMVSPLNKIKELSNKCNIKDIFEKNDLIAIKVHFGELGNTAFLRPIFLRPIVETLKEIGTKPYLTDTNTLYVGMRTNSVDHLHNAFLNGFNYFIAFNFYFHICHPLLPEFCTKIVIYSAR